MYKISFTPLYMFCLANLTHGDYSSHGYSVFNLIVAYLFSIICGGVLFFLFMFLAQNSRKFYVDEVVDHKFRFIYQCSKLGLYNYFFLVIGLLNNFVFAMLCVLLEGYGIY